MRPKKYMDGDFVLYTGEESVGMADGGRIGFKDGPKIIGTNQVGTPEAAQERLKQFVDNFLKNNKRLPGKQEIRKLGNFDFYTIKKGIDSGKIEVLENLNTISQSKVPNEQILKLSKSKIINDIFKTGKTSIKDINKVKKVIGNVSDSVAATRILQLANIYSGSGAEDFRNLNIKPKFKNNAAKILTESPYTGYIRNVNEALIGKSVGEPSIKGTKSKIVQDADYIKTNIAKAYDIDEPLGVASSVNRARTPYGIYGQIIDKTKNKMKVGWDARKSQLELELQEAIQSKDKKLINDAVRKFNKEARAAEKLFNKDRIKGTKKIVIPEVSLDRPNKTIANYKNLSDDYKKAFDAVHSNQGYSFKIPADLKPIPQIRKDLKDPKILSTVKESADLGAGRIYARIPLITDLFEIAESIPDDIRRAKYLKAGFKTLGIAATPLIIYDAYKAYEAGRPIAEVLESGLLGTDVLGSTKRLLALTPEEREARSVVKQDEMDTQIAEDFTGLDTDFAIPRIKTDLTLEEAQAKALAGDERVKALEAETNLQRSRARGFRDDDMTDQFLADGGRVNLSVGGVTKGAQLVFKTARQVSNALLDLKNSVFSNFHEVRFAKTPEETAKGIKKVLEPYVHPAMKDRSRKTSTLESIDNLKKVLPEEYHNQVNRIKASTEQNDFISAYKIFNELDEGIDATLKFENTPKKYFPMVDPVNDAFIILDPTSRMSQGRYFQRVSMELDKVTGQPTGKYIRESYDTWDPVNNTFRKPGEEVLQGVSTDKGKTGLN